MYFFVNLIHYFQCNNKVCIMKRGDIMPLQYKIDILDALKSKGLNTNILRKEKLFSNRVIQALRDKSLYNGQIFLKHVNFYNVK